VRHGTPERLDPSMVEHVARHGELHLLVYLRLRRRALEEPKSPVRVSAIRLADDLGVMPEEVRLAVRALATLRVLGRDVERSTGWPHYWVEPVEDEHD
jgi:hypothetical protein